MLGPGCSSIKIKPIAIHGYFISKEITSIIFQIGSSNGGTFVDQLKKSFHPQEKKDLNFLKPNTTRIQ